MGHSVTRLRLAPVVMVSGSGSSVHVPAPRRKGKQQLSAGASEYFVIWTTFKALYCLNRDLFSKMVHKG